MNKKISITITALLLTATAYCQNNKGYETLINKIQSLKEYKSELHKAKALTRKDGIDTKITVLIDTNTTALTAPKLTIPGSTVQNKIKVYINEVQGEKSTVAYEIQMDKKTQKVLSVKRPSATM